MTQELFGHTRDGIPVEQFTLEGPGGRRAQVLTYGGILRTFTIPTGDGERDVVLGFDRLADYEKQDKYIGALVGRVANRIGAGRFTLEGKEYQLAINNGPNCNHGGIHGFHEKVWEGEARGETLVLRCQSPDGEENFPGNLSVEVEYSFTPEGALRILYTARTDRPTILNLTNHSYFNLKGKGEIGGHWVRIPADRFTENDPTSLPTGRLLPVEGTPFDLREGRTLAEGMADLHPQMIVGAGYDHNYVLKEGWDDRLVEAAEVRAGGLRLLCHTTQPGVQLYTGNWLGGEKGKGGQVYSRRTGLCLETQNWPDAINKPRFPSPILRPGEEYRQETRFLLEPLPDHR